MRLAPSATQPYRATIARLRPSHAQWVLLEAEERRARWVWNRTIALGRRLRGRGRRLSFAAACTRLTRWRGRRPWLAEGSVVVQQQVGKAATEALAAWGAGQRGRPRFKSGRRHDPVALRYTARGLGEVTATHVALAKLGAVTHGATRPLHPVSSVDLVRDRRGWLVAFRERIPADCLPPLQEVAGPDAVLGLDFGVAQTWTLSSGEAVRVPVLDPTAQRRLRQLDRTLARRRRPRGQRPSHRYQQARTERARVHRQVCAQRRDLLRTLAKRLAARAAALAVEDLALVAMTRRRRGRGRRAKAALNRALLAQSRGELLQALASAVRWTGAQVVPVPAAFTSQTCSSCGHVARENRESQAVFRCLACGHLAHADVNAAVNIRDRGWARLAAPPTPVARPAMTRRAGSGGLGDAATMNRIPAERTKVRSEDSGILAL